MITELLLTVTVALAAYVYFSVKSVYSFFKEKGVRSVPVVPLFGNIMECTLGMKHMIYVYDRIYKTFPNERITGFFEFMQPIFMLRDPELIKQVSVKDFDHFVDHREFFSDESDQIFNNSLISLKGDKWRDMRSTLSPAFTGLKMRNMCPFIVECGHQVVAYLKNETDKNSSNKEASLEIDMNDIYTRYATDVIASSAFGFKTDSLVDRQNKFFVTGKQMTNFTGWQFFKGIIVTTMPKIASVSFEDEFFDPEITKFFKNIYMTTVKYRKENNIVRPDMINILMEIKKGSLKHETQTTNDDAGFATVEESDIGKRESKRVWTDNELTSQAFLFFLAGFETVSTALSFTSMKLAENPDVQARLREEVDANYPENGDLTFESIQKLTYLDMVVSESLRVWSPLAFIDRMCLKTYNVRDKDGNKTDIVIEKGNACIIPVRQLHYDPLYWEEPEKFDPERFSAENKHKIQPFTYMPFGLGPRNCIGSRFALMEVKVILFYLIRNFIFTSCPRTMNPIILPKNTFAITLPEGFWIKMIPRDIK